MIAKIVFISILVSLFTFPPNSSLASSAKSWCLLPEHYKVVEPSEIYPDAVRLESTKTGNSCFCTPHGGDIIGKSEGGHYYLLGCINPDTGEFEPDFGGGILPSIEIPD